MKRLICILTLALAFSSSVRARPQNNKAEEIIERYLSMAHPDEDKLGEARIARLETLARLKAEAETAVDPETAVDVIARILPKVNDAKQRCEIAEALGRHFQNAKSAKVLCELLKDEDEQVRRQAIHGLRLMSRRTDRIGSARVIRRPTVASKADREEAAHRAVSHPKNTRAGHTEESATQQEPLFAPKVEGLVPYLVLAASDASEENRIAALFALADTREPAAVTEIRNRLNDDAENVRFFAACFLTEYQDASGLHELRSALERLEKTSDPESIGFGYYRQAGFLIASLERLLGKSFGPIPMDPHLLSDGRHAEHTKKRFKELIDIWSQWWAWQPS